MVIHQQLYSLDTPRVMAIINVTPDSFALSCRDMTEDQILSAASLALSQGADILDIGGCSTRPQSTPVEEAEEIRRVALALRVIRSAFPQAVLSVDTFRAAVAECAMQYGVDMINDVSGGSEAMWKVVAAARVPYVLTHSSSLNESDSVCQVLDFWLHRIEHMLSYGIHDIVVDPGFGFYKTRAQNYELLSRLDMLREVERPLLVGLSRKSMICDELNIQPDSDDALVGTTALHWAALERGASILRVHDVHAAVETIQLYNRFKVCSPQKEDGHQHITIIH